MGDILIKVTRIIWVYMALKTAVIGIGNMGRHHARVYSGLKSSCLVGVSDINKNAGTAIASKFGCNFYSDYLELLKRESPDIVSICVPTHLHYAVAKSVIESGSHLLIEKPISHNIKEAEELVKMAKDAGVKLTVGHVERFNPAIRKLKDIVVAGKLGNITSIMAQRVGLFPSQIDGNNVIIDLAIHDIDIFNYILGKEPESVVISSGRALNNKSEDYADIFLKYSGTNGFIEVNWITPVKIRILTLTGTLGFAQVNYITQTINLYKTVYEKNYDQFGDFVLKFGNPEMEKLQVERAEPIRLELEHFVDCIKNNKDPLVSGEDGIKALRIALNIL